MRSSWYIKNTDLQRDLGIDPVKAVIQNFVLSHLEQLHNHTNYFFFVPPQWKVAQIKMIVKPGNPAEDVKSYRPINLLPILSKVLELLFLNRLTPLIEERSLTPDHQFGFRKGHGTIEQVTEL